MKAFLTFCLVLILPLLAWSAWTYPQIGTLAYRLSMAAETRLYGLREHEVDIGGMSLSVYEGGPADAPVLVLLHGYSAENEHWARFARHLVDDYRVIAPDLAGHGDTGFQPDWDYRIAAQSGRIVALLDALEVEHAHIAGNSMGGFIAADFARRYPQRTLSATLLDPAGVASPEPSDMDRLRAAGDNPFLIKNREDFSRFYPMTMARPPWVPGFVLDAQAARYQARREELATIYAQLIASEPVEPHLDQILTPTLILWGAQDRLIHVSATEVWAQIPDVEVTVWDDLGHMPHVEAPGRSALRLREFLASLPH